MRSGATWLAVGITALGLTACCANTQTCERHKAKEEMKAKEETKVTMDQVPAAVKQTLQDETKGGTIGEIAKETKHDKVVYEADATINGKDYEIKVADDGTLLGKKLEDKKDEKKGGEDKD